MTTRSWNFSVEPGASNPTWSNRAISTALSRISRYFAVSFPQVSRSPWMRVVMTRRSQGASVAAWTTGRTIYIPASFRYQSADQLVFVLMHEFGHVFGGYSHGRSGDVMEASIRDVYRNFTQNDYRWFPLPQRPLKAWHEPNQWRPQSMVESRRIFEDLAHGMNLTVDDMVAYALDAMRAPRLTCGHGSLWDWAMSKVRKTEVVKVEDVYVCI